MASAKDPEITDKINQLAEMIAAGITANLPGGLAGLAPLGFKCTDYVCSGQEFTCSKFRCGAAFKIKALTDSPGEA